MSEYRSSWMTDELAAFRTVVRDFMSDTIVPNQLRWRAQHEVDRDFWREAGKAGLLCLAVPEEYGGSGASLAADIVVLEEQYRTGEAGWGNMVHSGITAHYLLHHGSEAQKRDWLPRLASGESVGAIAMSEPGAGSDLRGIATRAVQDGGDYLLSGSKTFITNGSHADLVIIAAKTRASRDSDAITLFLVDADTPGFRRGNVLDKIGLPSADTAELFFDDLRVPAGSVLGTVGGGMRALMGELSQERLLIGVAAVAAAEAAVAETAMYVSQRHAFEQPLSAFQNTRFELADCATSVHVGRVFVDSCIERHLAGALDTATASMAKLWLTDMQTSVVDRCLQLYGGYGYMNEYAIGRAFVDARVQRIYGGANEVMKELIARSVLPAPGS